VVYISTKGEVEEFVRKKNHAWEGGGIKGGKTAALGGGTELRMGGFREVVSLNHDKKRGKKKSVGRSVA